MLRGCQGLGRIYFFVVAKLGHHLLYPLGQEESVSRVDGCLVVPMCSEMEVSRAGGGVSDPVGVALFWLIGEVEVRQSDYLVF